MSESRGCTRIGCEPRHGVRVGVCVNVRGGRRGVVCVRCGVLAGCWLLVVVVG